MVEFERLFIGKLSRDKNNWSADQIRSDDQTFSKHSLEISSATYLRLVRPSVLLPMIELSASHLAEKTERESAETTWLLSAILFPKSEPFVVLRKKHVLLIDRKTKKKEEEEWIA